MSFRSQRQHSSTLQRGVAGLLLFLLVTDLGFHFAESFLESPQHSERMEFRLNHEHSGPDDGCPIPGHGGKLFHHHHYPGVVTQASLPLPLVAVAAVLSTPRAKHIHFSLITPIGRAPPVRF